jgi:transposase
LVQAGWVVLIKPKIWERPGLKPWIEAARQRLHDDVLAIALANKLARIAWSVLARGQAFEVLKINQAAPSPADPNSPLTATATAQNEEPAMM